MRVLLIGDPHLRINKFSLAIEFLTWLNGHIKDQKPDVVINLGDSLDTHAIIRSEVLNELMNHIYYVLDLGIPYIYLRGNHDQYSSKDTKYHALLPFKGKIANLYIVDEPQDLFGMTFVPYMVKGEDFPKTTLPVCVAHQTFLGADYGAINAKEGIDPKSINADIIISGHIHKKHNIDKVVYVGSPYSQEAADVDSVKGISIFDTATYKFSFTQTPLPSWHSFKFEICQDQTVELLHSTLLETVKNSNDHWVIELKGPKAEVVSYIDSAGYKNLTKSISIRLRTVFTDKEKKKVSINAVSMEQILKDYIDRVYNGGLDKDILLSKAKIVLSNVKSRQA